MQQSGCAEAIIAANSRRNFLLLGCDYVVFTLGWTFASTSTILPAFAERLGASNLLIGAIPAAMTLGSTLPPLFAANHTERLARKLPMVLRWTSGERLPFLLLAATAYLLAERSPALTLAVLLLSVLSMAGSAGALTPAWMDLIAKVIPAGQRGRLIGGGCVLGCLLGLAGTALSGCYLRTFPFPDSYALCFLTGFACVVVSWVGLTMIVEPAVPSRKPHLSTVTYLRCLPAVLVRDRSFTWFLVFRATAVLGGMATAFYTVHALRTLAAPVSMVAQFTTVLLAGQIVANLGLGWLGDRAGHRSVLLVGTALTIVGNAAALASRRPELLYITFACSGAAAAATNVSILNMSVDFAPEADRPTYVGLASTVAAPVAVAATLVGGALADVSGYRAVFAVAAITSAVALAVLLFAVEDPREHREVPAPDRLPPG